MRRPSIRSIAAALALIPLASTCTLPHALPASAAQQFSLADEDRLVEFLIEGDRRGGIPVR
jgi:hypothetical protein